MERKLMTTQKELDEIANNFGTKQKDPKYKKLWYNLEENGLDNIKRRTVSTNSSYKTDDGWNSVDKRR